MKSASSTEASLIVHDGSSPRSVENAEEAGPDSRASRQCIARQGRPARLAEAMERELETPRDSAQLRARAKELWGVDRAVDAHERLLLAG